MKKKLEFKAAPDWNILMRRWNSASAAYEAAAGALGAALESGADTIEYQADEAMALAELQEVKLEIDALIQQKSAARRPNPDSLVIGFMDDDAADQSGSMPVSEKGETGNASERSKPAAPAKRALGRKSAWLKP